MGQNAILRGAGSAIQQGQHTALRAGTDRLIDEPTVLEDQQRRDAHDAELGGEVRLLVHIDLAHLDIGQGPHQLAQKSSSTGFSLCSTSASKFSVVIVMGSISSTSCGCVCCSMILVYPKCRPASVTGSQNTTKSGGPHLRNSHTKS